MQIVRRLLVEVELNLILNLILILILLGGFRHDGAGRVASCRATRSAWCAAHPGLAVPYGTYGSCSCQMDLVLAGRLRSERSNEPASWVSVGL